MCSGRKPTAINRAGIRRSAGHRRRILNNQGSCSGCWLPSTLRIALFCSATCICCVAFVGNARRRCTASTSSSDGAPRRSASPKRFAVATASWIARLIPTPPIGDMACAASPIQSSPGRAHSCSRSTATVSKLTLLQSCNSETRSLKNGSRPAISCRNASSPRFFIFSASPLGITNAHCQYLSRLISTSILPLSA